MVKPSFIKDVANYLSSFTDQPKEMDQTLTVIFKYHSSITLNVLYPENFGVGIARFGGMFAVLRGLMIVMHWINRRQFEKKLKRFYRKENNSKAEGL